MSNIETFNTITGLIFADLYDSFPVPVNLDSFHYALKSGLVKDHGDIGMDDELPASAAIDWLIAEGFIRCGSESMQPTRYYHCVLSHRGLQLLSLPSSLNKQEAIGEQISKAVKSGTLEGVKTLAKTIMCEGARLAFQATINAAMQP